MKSCRSCCIKIALKESAAISSAKQPDPDLRAKGWQQEQEQEQEGVHTPCTFKQKFVHTLCTFKHFQDYKGDFQTLTNQFRYSGYICNPSSTLKTINSVSIKSICRHKQILTTFETHAIKMIDLHTFNSLLRFNFKRWGLPCQSCCCHIYRLIFRKSWNFCDVKIIRWL